MFATVKLQNQNQQTTIQTGVYITTKERKGFGTAPAQIRKFKELSHQEACCAMAMENSNSFITVEDAFWKIKEALNSLEADKIPSLVGMLRDELAKTVQGSNSKSRILLDAIGLIKQTLEEFLPLDSEIANGNAVMATEDIAKEEDVYIKSVHTTENATIPNISDDDNEGMLGIVFIDAYDALFGTFRYESGHLEIIHKLSVVPPIRPVRGGQVAYVALRGRKHIELIKKTVEAANKLFLNPATGQVNVSGGLLVGGSNIGRSFFHKLAFDSRVRAKVLYEVDVSLGGEEGLKAAIERWCVVRGYSLRKKHLQG